MSNLCSNCGKSCFLGRKDCLICKAAYNQYMKRYREEARKNKLCVSCLRPAEEGQCRCADCRIKDNKDIAKKRKSNKDKVFLHYGGYICACCGETRISFLTIDHVNNDGASHKVNGRRLTGHMLCSWIIKNHFPSGFQVLCWNCNCGKINGVCPHVLEAQNEELLVR